METLDEAQKRDIDAKLGAMEADISARLADQDSPVPPPDTAEEREVGDAVDMAEQNTERRDDLALLDHYRGQLADIQSARRRLREGNLGICVDCGQPIPFARLQAYPTAKRCAPCQQRREHLFAQQ